MSEGTVAIAADHAGYPLKEILKIELEARGFTVRDLGTHSEESVDYPDFGKAVGEAVAGGDAARGVIICGTGIGISIAANRIAEVRAASGMTTSSMNTSRRSSARRSSSSARARSSMP